MTEDQEDEPFEVCIIDADSLIYQIAYTTVSPALAKKALDKTINSIVETVIADSVHVFIKGRDNFRFKADPLYKANRVATIEPEIKDRIDKLYVYAREICVEGHMGEADDYCAIVASECAEEGRSYIVAHIDKDLDCIPGYHYNFKKQTFYEMTDHDAYRWVIKQLLTGDATDNIKGLKGIGTKRADNMLADVPNSMLLDLATEAYGISGRDDFIKTANCIMMRTSLEDLRPFNYAEILERLEWKKKPDTGLPLQTDPILPLDSCMQFSDQPEDSILAVSN